MREIAALLLLYTGLFCNINAAEIRDLYSDTWVAIDDLGRRMPTHSEAGPVKKDKQRVVGIFYITWHSDKEHYGKGGYNGDLTKLYKKDNTARLDAKHPLWKRPSYHFAEPELGYYLSKDPYVIRKDMSMLADAGVDVLILDVTNAVRYWDEWKAILSEMQKMKETKSLKYVSGLIMVLSSLLFKKSMSEYTKLINIKIYGSIGMVDHYCYIIKTHTFSPISNMFLNIKT